MDAAQQETAMQEGMSGVETAGIEAQEVAVEQVESAQDALMDMSIFYFDFDETTIKSDSKNALIAHAQYLAVNSSARVVLEGHADERGTVEYNLALGERRALSVSRFLQANGASASQIETVSFGEERPQMMGHNTNSWSQNRRVEIKYLSR
jgi:peptidoglycan-associated lipoprotein